MPSGAARDTWHHRHCKKHRMLPFFDAWFHITPQARLEERPHGYTRLTASWIRIHAPLPDV
jgi:hypothetical protein